MVDRIEMGEIKPGQSQDIVRKKLEHACKEFESLFVTYLLKSQQSLSVENSFFGENKIIQAMFHENIANEISESGGVGLGDMLFERFKEKYLDFSS